MVDDEGKVAATRCHALHSQCMRRGSFPARVVAFETCLFACQIVGSGRFLHDLWPPIPPSKLQKVEGLKVRNASVASQPPSLPKSKVHLHCAASPCARQGCDAAMCRKQSADASFVPRAIGKRKFRKWTADHRFLFPIIIYYHVFYHILSCVYLCYIYISYLYDS